MRVFVNYSEYFSSIVVKVSLLLSLNFHDSVHKVFVGDRSSSTSQGNHTLQIQIRFPVFFFIDGKTYGFHTNSLALGSVEVVRRPWELLKVDILADIHFPRVNLHDPSSGFFIGVGEFDLPIQATRSQQGRVKDIHSVSGSNDLENSSIFYRFNLIYLKADTLISDVELKPSNWFSNSNMVLCTSLSPAFSESNLLVPMASSSSMKIIAGDFSLARANASRTNFAPSPINICTSWGPASLRNVDFVWAAQALASNVLPEKNNSSINQLQVPIGQMFSYLCQEGRREALPWEAGFQGLQISPCGSWGGQRLQWAVIKAISIYFDQRQIIKPLESACPDHQCLNTVQLVFRQPP